MAEEAPKKESTTESPNEAYPPSAKAQQSEQQPGQTEAAPGAPGAEEPSTNEEAIEEEQVEEEEVGHRETAQDEEGKPETPQAPDKDDRPIRPRKVKRSMEYALAEMYPEMQLLVDHKRRDWNFTDPDVIRALFLEAKTNAVASWKEGHSRFSMRKKPLLEIQETTASKLRRQQLETRQEKLQQEQQRLERIVNHRQPEFAEVKLATNLTTQLRYNYTRNNPAVPRHFLAHYERFKRPPFYNYGHSNRLCGQDMYQL